MSTNKSEQKAEKARTPIGQDHALAAALAAVVSQAVCDGPTQECHWAAIRVLEKFYTSQQP